MDIQAFLAQAYPGQAETGTSLPQAHGVTDLVTAAPPSLAERSPLDWCQIS